MRKVIFFDRDGTLIVDKIYLNDPEQIVFLPRVFESLQLLKSHGFDFIIATNQSGVARGIVTLENLNEIHRRMQSEFEKHGVEFLDFQFAPYMTDSNHPLRKPNAGMLLESGHKFGVDYAASWMVGDRMTDVEAGHRAGTRTILLGDNESPEGSPYAPPDHHVPDLWAAAQVICR